MLSLDELVFRQHTRFPMDTILDNENYSDTMRLQILSLCATAGVNKFSGAVTGEAIAVISSNHVYPCTFYFIYF